MSEERLEKLKQYGIDLPDIPGLPVQVIPVHVHAIKVTAKLVRRQFQEEVLAPTFNPLDNSHERTTEDSQSNSNNNGADVLQAILQRVDEAASSRVTDQASLVERQKIRRSYQEGVQAWLDAIHRCVRDRRRETNNTTDETTTTTTTGSYRSVPVAALQHLWDTSYSQRLDDSSREVLARRTTLHLMGKLLERSAEGREWWFSSESLDSKSPRLIQWMDIVLNKKKNDSQSSHHDATQMQLWQREAYLLLQHLDSKGFGTFYPTLSVALQRFEQLASPHVVQGHMVSSPPQQAPYDLRRIRDGAMKHCSEMEARVRNLVDKCQACLDILVPRMVPDEKKEERGGPEAPGDAADGSYLENDNFDGSENEDDDDIDWEDGWDVEEVSSPPTDHSIDESPEAHALAVERTLQAMQSTGGIREDSLEVDMGECSQPAGLSTGAENSRASERLSKLTKILEAKFMPRLSLWVEALTNADLLVESSVGNDSGVKSMVSMSSEMLLRRREALNSCVYLKQNVARILASAKRLGLERDLSSSESNATNLTAREVRPPIRLATAERNTELASRLRTKKRRIELRERDWTRGRSHRIQIKFNKR